VSKNIGIAIAALVIGGALGVFGSIVAIIVQVAMGSFCK
jgi:hypothetical protein